MRNKIKKFLKDYHKFEGKWFKWSPIFHGESIPPDGDEVLDFLESLIRSENTKKKPISDLLPRFYNKDYVNEKGEKIRLCMNCGRKLIPYIYKKKDGFPKLVGKSDGHTYWCKCFKKGLLISIG